MSNIADLAPMVASVLRDKAVDDLLLENANLKSKLSLTKLVEITGRGGAPVYATGDISTGDVAGGGQAWLVAVEQHHPAICPLEDISELQVRLGGVSLIKRHWLAHSGCSVVDYLIGAFDAADRSGLFEWTLRFCSSSVTSMMVRCEPFDSYVEYLDTDAGRANYSCANLMTLANERTGMTVRFEHVEFELSEMQMYLDRHGISTNVGSAMEDDSDNEADGSSR